MLEDKVFTFKSAARHKSTKRSTKQQHNMLVEKVLKKASKLLNAYQILQKHGAKMTRYGPSHMKVIYEG